MKDNSFNLRLKWEENVFLFLKALISILRYKAKTTSMNDIKESADLKFSSIWKEQR